MTAFDCWDGELYHHGILGQKWGIRRFQNKDGSMTSAGKKRRRMRDMSNEDLEKSIKRLELEKRYKELNKGPIVRAYEGYVSYKNNQAKWRDNKSHLIAAKVSRSRLPLRNAIQSIPADLITAVNKRIISGFNKTVDILGDAVKDSYETKGFGPVNEARANSSGDSKRKKKKRQGYALPESDYSVK